MNGNNLSVHNIERLNSLNENEINSLLETNAEPKTATVLIHANWCGHCKDFLPKFKQLLKQMSKKLKKENGKYHIYMIEHEAFDEYNKKHPNNDLVNNVDGFPTLLNKTPTSIKPINSREDSVLMNEMSDNAMLASNSGGRRRRRRRTRRAKSHRKPSRKTRRKKRKTRRR